MTKSIKKSVNSRIKDTILFYLNNLNQSVFIYNCDISLDKLIYAYDFNLIPIIVSNSYDNVISYFNNQNIVILVEDSTIPENMKTKKINIFDLTQHAVCDIVKQFDKQKTIFICQNNKILDQLLPELSYQSLIYFDSLSSRKEILYKLDEKTTLEGDFNDCCNKGFVLLTFRESIDSSVNCTDGRITFNALNDCLDKIIMEKSLKEAICYYQTEEFPIPFLYPDTYDSFIDCSNSIAEALSRKNIFMETLIFMQSCLPYETVNLNKFISNNSITQDYSNLNKFVKEYINSNQFKYFDIDKSNREYRISTLNQKLLSLVLENTKFINTSKNASFNKSSYENLYKIINDKKFTPEEIYMFDDIYRLNRTISFCKYIYDFPVFGKIPYHIKNCINNCINSDYFLNESEYNMFFYIFNNEQIKELDTFDLEMSQDFLEETYNIIQPTAQAIFILKLIIKYNALDLNETSIKQIIFDMKQTEFYNSFEIPKCYDYTPTRTAWENYCKIRDFK